VVGFKATDEWPDSRLFQTTDEWSDLNRRVVGSHLREICEGNRRVVGFQATDEWSDILTLEKFVSSHNRRVVGFQTIDEWSDLNRRVVGYPYL
jgi:hypothetical protein